MKTVFIYALKEPDTGEIRYIGKAMDPIFRLNRHIFRAAKNIEGNHKNCWIRSLLAKGMKPCLEIIDEAGLDTWPSVEAAYIQFYKESECNLVNSTNGGEGVEMTPETRRKIGDKTRLTSRGSTSNLGLHKSFETRSKISASKKGKSWSLEARQAHSKEIRRGREHSQESKQNMKRAAIRRCQRIAQEKILDEMWD